MPSLHRRQFLRGIGTVIALPFMESIVPTAVLRAAERTSGSVAAPPLRTAFIYMPNGVNNDYWWPKGKDRNFTLGSSMQPLEPHKQDIQIIAGLGHTKANPNGDGAGDHARASASFLTGAQAKKSANDLRLGQSVDQVIASQLGGKYRLPSLELSCDPPRQVGNCDSGYGCAYSYNLSWRTESQPMPAERNPRLVFERMFGSGEIVHTAESRAAQARRRRSILDFVRDDARRLKSDLSHGDQGKLDEYLTSVREIELRVDSFETFSAQPEHPLPSGIPDSYDEHIRLMCDLLVLAFQTKSTPVATLLLAHEASGRTFPQLGITEGHHSLSHHEKRPEKLEQIRKIDTFYMDQFAYLLGKMKSVKEGDGTLLDNSMLVFGSGIRDGDRHDHVNLPVILAGRGRGALNPGCYVEYRDTPMSNLYLSMLGLHNIPAERLGDSSGRLKLV